MEVDRHFIKEKIEDGTVYMIYVPTNEQVINLLIKALIRRLFEQQITKLGIFNLYILT